jgi:hypothetical protein
MHQDDVHAGHRACAPHRFDSSSDISVMPHQLEHGIYVPRQRIGIFFRHAAAARQFRQFQRQNHVRIRILDYFHARHIDGGKIVHVHDYAEPAVQMRGCAAAFAFGVRLVPSRE